MDEHARKRIESLRESIPGHRAMVEDIVRRNRDAPATAKTYGDSEILRGWFHRDYQVALDIRRSNLALPPVPGNEGAAWEKYDRLEAWCHACLNSAAADPQQPKVAKLPELRPHDRQAYKLWVLGMKQRGIADALNAEHGTTYKQYDISRMVARAKAHAEASGLAALIPEPADRAIAIDPASLELGHRTDRRTSRQRQRKNDA